MNYFLCFSNSKPVSLRLQASCISKTNINSKTVWFLMP